MAQVDLFEPEYPEGFHYRSDFISADDEAALLAAIEHIAFQDFELRGVVARRRVAFFGESYAQNSAEPMPPFLLPLRAALAAWAQIQPDALAMALINEYRAGAPIGWHRDAPQYELIAGVSLLSPCRMKLRPYVRPSADRVEGTRRTATHELVLAPRSAYLLSGPARSDYEHHIPPVEQSRYSVTFRTLRPTRAAQ